MRSYVCEIGLTKVSSLLIFCLPYAIVYCNSLVFLDTINRSEVRLK